MIQKTEWRQLLLRKRKAISPKRRAEASIQLCRKLNPKGNVLSFITMGSEIDTSHLNRLLEEERRLFIPQIKGDILWAPLDQINCILVPGLGFDREFFRIGYGKGYYDRFLAAIPSLLTIGIGFVEQYCEEIFPRDSWDIPVKELCLV